MQVLLLDLDETLYPRGNGVLGRIDARINSYMISRLGIPSADVDAERVRLRDRYGTTMHGLVQRFAIDFDDYLHHCHGVDLSDLLSPDPELRALLERLPVRKALLTNAPRAHARQVLGLLGIDDLMEQVITIEDVGYRPKPAASAYDAALARLEARPHECLFVDDTLGCVHGAVRRGLHAAWMAPRDAAAPPPPEDAPHHVIHDVRDLEPLLARLRNGA